MSARAPAPVGATCNRSAAGLGGAALCEETLLELADAVADVERVGHDDSVRDALAVVLGEAPGEAAVLGAVTRGVLGGHARELAEEAGGVWAQPAEDLGDERDDLLPALARVDVVADALLDVALAGVVVEGLAVGVAPALFRLIRLLASLNYATPT